MKNDPLGDRMKSYEAQTVVPLMPMLPTFARVDGRAFHTFTRGLERPYDTRLSAAMIDVAVILARETNADMAYTQSDEITLVWLAKDIRSQIWFAAKHSKMVSQIAALATLHFYRSCQDRLPEYAEKLPTFDARVWQVPNLQEAANVFLWREWDATKNSITMAASAHYAHEELQGKTGKQKQEMLFQKNINWNDYPVFFKRGTYVQRQYTVRCFTPSEITRLPAKHAAHMDPDLMVVRSSYEVLDMPVFTTVTNKQEVLFEGKPPETNAS